MLDGALPPVGVFFRTVFRVVPLTIGALFTYKSFKYLHLCRQNEPGLSCTSWYFFERDFFFRSLNFFLCFSDFATVSLSVT